MRVLSTPNLPSGTTASVLPIRAVSRRQLRPETTRTGAPLLEIQSANTAHSAIVEQHGRYQEIWRATFERIPPLVDMVDDSEDT